MAKTRLLDYLINGFTNRLENWYDAMPHVTEHAPKVSTRSVNPYARESSREKRQQGRQTDRQTDTHTHRLPKTTFLVVLRVVGTSQIQSYLEFDFLHDAANTSIDMEVKRLHHVKHTVNFRRVLVTCC